MLQITKNSSTININNSSIISRVIKIYFAFTFDKAF